MSATLQISGDQLSIEGPMTVDTVAGLLTQSEAASMANVQLDLERVSEMDSAGLALLLLWKNGAEQQGGKFKLYNISAQSSSLMRISGLEHLAA